MSLCDLKQVKSLVIIECGYGGHAAYSFAIAYELAKLGFKLDTLLSRGYEYLAWKFERLGNQTSYWS